MNSAFWIYVAIVVFIVFPIIVNFLSIGKAYKDGREAIKQVSLLGIVLITSEFMKLHNLRGIFFPVIFIGACLIIFLVYILSGYYLIHIPNTLFGKILYKGKK